MSPDEIDHAVAATISRFKQIDLLVNDAGIAWMGPALDMPLAALQAMLRVNVEGVFIMSRAVLPHMIARHSGSVINLASWAGKTGPAHFAGYGASKFAVIGLWQRLLGRPASESGTLRHGDGTHGRSDRCRRSFVLPILSERSSVANLSPWRNPYIDHR
jgi:NAD(P)-dependent dehydrogenase (short-subunit alcohol dehydrogenase family)